MFDERAQGPKGRGELVSLLLNFFLKFCLDSPLWTWYSTC